MHARTTGRGPTRGCGRTQLVSGSCRRAGMLQAHSDVQLLFHVVFATSGRRALLPPLSDDWLHRRLRLEAGGRGVRVLGVGNAADHVHLVLELHASSSLATVVGQLKGVSSHAWNVSYPATPLRWEKGYWARTGLALCVAPLRARSTRTARLGERRPTARADDRHQARRRRHHPRVEPATCGAGTHDPSPLQGASRAVGAPCFQHGGNRGAQTVRCSRWLV